ncbi:hypothetical protein [Sporolactobacillus sp. KGMB 08714]|uniref:hypothetical protein n=1 Tax=Sporolactobacillus sp. KGMB 08714 TaxID=3064704 RepID=UPI002FBE5834
MKIHGYQSAYRREHFCLRAVRPILRKRGKADAYLITEKEETRKAKGTKNAPPVKVTQKEAFPKKSARAIESFVHISKAQNISS